MNDESPQFKHACERCVFLGRWRPSCADDPDIELKDFDLYFCPAGKLCVASCVISRYGDDDDQYTVAYQAMPESQWLPDLHEAAVRAHARGLL